MAPKVEYVVTGGAGFIGSHIAQALLARGSSVRIFDCLPAAIRPKFAHLAGRVEFIQGDLRDLSSVRAAVDGARVIFHQGALASVPRSIAEPIASLESNVNGTLHVLLAARDTGAQRVVYASSSAVYGESPTLPKNEEMPTAPISPYAVQKLAAEQLCQVFTRVYGLETVALRYFNVFGPRQDPRSEYAAVIPRFISALLSGRQPTVYGDGEQTRDFTYVGNVVGANLLAAEVPVPAGVVMNIGSGQRISLNEVLRLASQWLGVKLDPVYASPRQGDIRDSLADISRARAVLGYSPDIDFEEGLRQTIEAMRAGSTE